MEIMEEMIEIPRLNDNIGLNIPWLHGGLFRKRLTSSPLHNEPAGKQANMMPNMENYFTRLVQGFEPGESCVTVLSDLKPGGNNIDTFNAVQSHSETAEDGISDTTQEDQQNAISMAVPAADAGKGRKRKRQKVSKNSEEVLSQRITHIEVERNRRKQMNAHLDVLRSLIPQSYIQRGDQASIIGGAIDLVKELEQVLQSLQFQKIKRENVDRTDPTNCLSILPPHQSSARCNSKCVVDTSSSQVRALEDKSSIADIEVTLIETHGSLKILSKKKHGQLLKIITALESFHMTILHLNITSMDETVVFSFNVKVEDECQLTSADEIASSLHRILRIVHAC